MSRIRLTRGRKKADKLITDAITILDSIGMPVDGYSPRARERVALTFLALANLRPADSWPNAYVWDIEQPRALTTREIITFRQTHYDEDISSGSYDDVRRKDLIDMVLSGIVIKSAVDPMAATNNPRRGYAIATECAELLHSFGDPSWQSAVKEFLERNGSLSDRLARKRDQAQIPVTLPSGEVLKLEPGKHNELQVAIIEELLPRFLQGADVLYVADANNKSLHLDESKLTQLGFSELAHDMLPDVVAYLPDKNWLALIEAVLSSNPLSGRRHLMLEEFVRDCTAPAVYISVFADRKNFRSWVEEISWETEVWLADAPDHMIHFNGDRFLGPHANQPSQS